MSIIEKFAIPGYMWVLILLYVLANLLNVMYLFCNIKLTLLTYWLVLLLKLDAPGSSSFAPHKYFILLVITSSKNNTTLVSISDAWDRKWHFQVLAYQKQPKDSPN
jgi:hypothetical protein